MVDAPRRRARRSLPPFPAAALERGATRTVYSLSEEETFEFGRAAARSLGPGELILLEGALGTGKTVFARGVAAGLGVRPEDVSSPSFTLVQEYRTGRLPVFHVDLYRIDRPEDLASIGFEELLAAGGVVIVEWAEKLPPYLRRGAFVVRLFDAGEGSRRITLSREPKRPARPRGDA